MNKFNKSILKSQQNNDYRVNFTFYSRVEKRRVEIQAVGRRTEKGAREKSSENRFGSANSSLGSGKDDKVPVSCVESEVGVELETV